MKFESRSEKETFSFAKKLAKKLNGGEAIALIGNLGAGKTVFAKGLAAGLGVRQKITSPTFVLMRTYPITRGTIKTLIHIDAYRLKTTTDLEAIGAKEYLKDKTAVVVVEWADRVKKFFTPDYRISFEIKTNSRLIKILKKYGSATKQLTAPGNAGERSGQGLPGKSHPE